jgi:hypothetical protein
MDPDAALARLREIAAEILSPDYDIDSSTSVDPLAEIAEQFQALDEWIDWGGFLPTAWRVGQQRERRLPSKREGR